MGTSNCIIFALVLVTLSVNVNLTFAEDCTLVCATGLYADYNRCTCLPIPNSGSASNPPAVSDEGPSSGTVSGNRDREGRGDCFLKCADNLYADYDKCTCFPKSGS